MAGREQAAAPQATPALNTFGHVVGRGGLRVSWRCRDLAGGLLAPNAIGPGSMCPSCPEFGLTPVGGSGHRWGWGWQGTALVLRSPQAPSRGGLSPDTRHGWVDREDSHLCLSRCEPSNSKEEPGHIPLPWGSQTRLTSTRTLVQVPHPLSGPWPSAAGPRLMVCGERSIRNNPGEAGACVSPPQHTGLCPKPGLWVWFPQRSPGAHGEVPKPVPPSWARSRQGRNTARLKPAAWKNAHSGRMPSKDRKSVV